MNDNTITSLIEALKQSPDNVPLRLLLADTYLLYNRLEEAEDEYKGVLAMSDNTSAKTGLANIYFKKGQYSACNVILEELISKGLNDLKTYSLYAKGLLKEGALERSIEMYENAMQIDPNYYDEELDKHLKVRSDDVENKEEDLDGRFLEKPDMNFEDVGGMDDVKKEIDLKIIRPLLHPELYKAYGKKAGGGDFIIWSSWMW